MDRWMQEEKFDMDKFIHDCYENDIVYESEDAPMIGYEQLIDRFTLFWHGQIKYFESHETAEDWWKLNKARECGYGTKKEE
jgi:hypothetical protein